MCHHYSPAKLVLSVLLSLATFNLVNGQDIVIQPLAQTQSQTLPFTDCSCGSASCESCRTGFRHTRLFHRCPNCLNDGVCQLTVKEGKEKKTCYKIDTKQICIPPVRLPWQTCVNQCGKSRTIRVLKTESYECPKCEYSWSVVNPEILPFETTASPTPAPVPGVQTKILGNPGIQRQIHTRPPVISGNQSQRTTREPATGTANQGPPVVRPWEVIRSR